jgi:hypothetical protein
MEEVETTTMAWEKAMWDELEAIQGAERLIAANEIITRMTQVLATRLAEERRLWAVHLIESGEYGYQQLADSVGIRVAVARRLVQEGRAVRVERLRQLEIAA